MGDAFILQSVADVVNHGIRVKRNGRQMLSGIGVAPIHIERGKRFAVIIRTGRDLVGGIPVADAKFLQADNLVTLVRVARSPSPEPER